MKKRVLVINAGWEQLPLLETLKEMEGIELWGISSDRPAIEISTFKKFLQCDIRDLDTILEFATDCKPDAVISDECDYSLFAQAMIAEVYGLPGPSIKSAQLSNNKYMQREVALAGQLLIPEYQLCLCSSEVKDFACDIGYPIIVKPIDNRGSIGVCRVDSDEQVSSAFYNAMINSHSRMVLAERFIHGQQVTVDGYCFRGQGAKSISIGAKYMAERNIQVALGISYPAVLENRIYDDILSINEHVNTMLGYDFGNIHSEYMITHEGKVYLIESSNRGGGVLTSPIIVPAVSGIDTLSQYIHDCLGNDVEHKLDRYENSVTLRFLSLAPGQIKQIHGWRAVESNENVIRSMLFVSSGDIIDAVSSDANRHGFIIVKGDNDLANEILERVHVTYE